MNIPVLTRDQLLDMAMVILHATNDGEMLPASDLKLVQLAVNNMLDPEGMALFQQLHSNATKPDGYTAPYLFGIEHLTIDQQGLVLWRGFAVEHFDHSVWKRPGWLERVRADAEEVAAGCRQLEAKSILPTVLVVLKAR
jgi:hypothetical protein